MIQVNLIPDLKAEFLKAQRTKRYVMGLAVLVSGAFVGLVAIMFLYVNVWQQEHTNNLNADIQRLSAEYQGIPDLDKVITVQNQLESLPDLHAEKPLVSRIVTFLSVMFGGIFVTSGSLVIVIALHILVDVLAILISPAIMAATSPPAETPAETSA